jgi:hypothetical protein
VGRVATPSLFSTLSAITELVVTAAVVYFFWRALKHQNYRWPIITAALVYETQFNITYMVSRFGAHTESENAAWYTLFVIFHGTLSLIMFLGLIGFVLWARSAYKAGDPHPLGRVHGLTYTFLALWGVSIVSGEILYILQFTDLAVAG